MISFPSLAIFNLKKNSWKIIAFLLRISYYCPEFARVPESFSLPHNDAVADVGIRMSSILPLFLNIIYVTNRITPTTLVYATHWRDFCSKNRSMILQYKKVYNYDTASTMNLHCEIIRFIFFVRVKLHAILEISYTVKSVIRSQLIIRNKNVSIYIARCETYLMSHTVVIQHEKPDCQNSANSIMNPDGPLSPQLCEEF